LPNLRAIFARISPRSNKRRATSSVCKTDAPFWRSRDKTALFPAPIPPVKPIFMTAGKGERTGFSPIDFLFFTELIPIPGLPLRESLSSLRRRGQGRLGNHFDREDKAYFRALLRLSPGLFHKSLVGILHQSGDGHRSHPARNRRDRRAFGGDRFEINVPGQFSVGSAVNA